MTLSELGVAPEVIAEFWPDGFLVDAQAALANIAAAQAETRLPCFPLARQVILSTFDLRCSARGPGIAMARTDFWLRPSEGLGAVDGADYRAAALLLGRAVFPLGVAQDDALGLGLDESGLCFCIFNGQLKRIAQSTGGAINSLAQGFARTDGAWTPLPDCD